MAIIKAGPFLCRRTCDVIEVVTYRHRNVHVRFKDGSTAWVAQEDFADSLPSAAVYDNQRQQWVLPPLAEQSIRGGQ